MKERPILFSGEMVRAILLERLQDISEEDAKAEGIPMEESPGYYGSLPGFVSLWDSLAKPGAKWSDNPWVWVIEFRRMENA